MSIGYDMVELPSKGGSYTREADGSLKRTEGPTQPTDNLGTIARSDSAEDVLEALQKRLRVSTDQALADALGLGRSTVTSWRRRGNVPTRYAQLVEQDTQKRLSAAFNFELLSDEERAALCLAVMRMSRGFLSEMQSYPEFLRRGTFIPSQISVHMDKALRDLLAEMESEEYQDAQQCLNAIVYSEMFSE